MKAFHGSQELKDYYVRQAKAHRAADEIAQGTYYLPANRAPDGRVKVCAIGCVLHSSRHEDYEPLLGIPSSMARFEELLFETMNTDTNFYKDFPVNFLEAVPVGADLSLVITQMFDWRLHDPEVGVLSAFHPGLQTPANGYLAELSRQVGNALRRGVPYKNDLLRLAGAFQLLVALHERDEEGPAYQAYLASSQFLSYLLDPTEASFSFFVPEAINPISAAVKLLELLAAAPQAAE